MPGPALPPSTRPAPRCLRRTPCRAARLVFSLSDNASNFKSSKSAPVIPAPADFSAFSASSAFATRGLSDFSAATTFAGAASAEVRSEAGLSPRQRVCINRRRCARLPSLKCAAAESGDFSDAAVGGVCDAISPLASAGGADRPSSVAPALWFAGAVGSATGVPVVLTRSGPAIISELSCSIGPFTASSEPASASRWLSAVSMPGVASGLSAAPSVAPSCSRPRFRKRRKNANSLLCEISRPVCAWKACRMPASVFAPLAAWQRWYSSAVKTCCSPDRASRTVTSEVVASAAAPRTICRSTRNRYREVDALSDASFDRSRLPVTGLEFEYGMKRGKPPNQKERRCTLSRGHMEGANLAG